MSGVSAVIITQTDLSQLIPFISQVRIIKMKIYDCDCLNSSLVFHLWDEKNKNCEEVSKSILIRYGFRKQPMKDNLVIQNVKTMFASAPSSPVRCRNPVVLNLIERIAETQRVSLAEDCQKIEANRKICHSRSLTTSRRIKFSNRPKFNNKCKEGQLIDREVRSIPYMFIPGYKNQTFILPDRAFAKSSAAKRMFIKMKDSSIYSFRESQDKLTLKAISKDEKERTIISRKVQEYNRIVDFDDGNVKAHHNRWFLKNRKKFTPTNTIEIFSRCDPMLEPKESESRTFKKISLAKTYDYRNRWRPVTRGSEAFTSSVSSSLYSDQQYPASVA